MALDFLNSFLTPFLEAVLPVLAAALAALVIAWIKKVVEQIKSKMDERMLWMLEEATRAAVLAAEQMNLSGQITDKKDYALRVATEWLESRGVKINLAIIEAKIEAAVLEEFNKQKSEDGVG